MNLPSRFYSIPGDCGCSPSSTPEPCCPSPTTVICDDRYLTMTYIPSGSILVIAPGTRCQSKLTEGAAGGLLVSLGAGLGFQPTVTPALALPTQAAAHGSFIPFLLGAMGAEPTTPWKRLTPPGSGNWYLTATSSGWTLTDADDIPSLINLFGGASNGTTLEMVGFVQTGTEDGQPVFEARKLIGSGSTTQPLVLQYNGTTGRYEVKAASLTDAYSVSTFKFTTIGEQVAGVATADGFPVRPNTGITVADVFPLVFDKGTGKVYRAPLHDYQVTSSATDQTLTLSGTYQLYPGHLQPSALTCNHPNVEVNWNVVFETHEQPIFGLFEDGVLIYTWDYSAVSVDPNTQFSGTYIRKGVTLGARTYDIRVKGGSATKLLFSGMTLKTLPA